MTRSIVSPSTAVPTQRNRRLLLTLPAAAALPSLLSACGGGADLSYDTEQALYFVGEAITPNKPEPAPPNPPPPGHTAPKFTVFPPLPAGLTLNAQTGVISGTPTKLKRQGTHLVVATNNKGFADTQVRITVTGRGAWVPVATVPDARQAACISPLPGGKFLVAGGLAGGGWNGATDSAEIYDAASATWRSAAPMLNRRDTPVSVTLRNGRVMVMGGYGYDFQSRATELYDPVADTWAATGSMNVSRNFFTAHLLPSGKVLVVGGLNMTSGAYDPLSTAEVYDPITGVWTLLPTPLSAPRVGHAAALLPDGKTLLVAGGADITSAELYKVDGSATKVIPYGVQGQAHQAVKLDDGSVLVVSSGSDQSKRFNPANSSWTTSALLGGGRNFPTVTVLADGRVLMAGGSVSNTAEVYNPDVNRWSAAAPMAAARQWAVATLLADGSVLMVSGGGDEGLVDASERYIP
ncbi:kelch repeat-containing protein [Hydrogenophaga sp. BPS33]|uniref:kelch repeat-containing protein n=1 Tax=Hydrogenophaga sp. BPS33 TaxID=2651974 RepID=UPI00131FFDB5|nr:kelch repeat-containing protein [Hydrogenophaga sp. BPS33]QHE86572.1 kelch-like protein [Hydrogenophaga sp. BPS33]